MIILDGDKLRGFWDNIAQGFQKSPLEAAISILIIALLIAVPVVLFLHKQKKDRNRKTDRARAVFDAYAAKKNLSEGDRDLLRKMCRHVSKGELELLDLATKPASFNAAAKRLMGAGDSGRVNDAMIARLRIKLGLVHSGSQGILHSTAEFYQGMPLQLAVESGRKMVGKVQEVQPDGFMLQVPERLAKGARVELRVRRPTGLYSLTTYVIGKRGNGYQLQHSERVERVQKRRFFRKVLRLPVLLAINDSSGATNDSSGAINDSAGAINDSSGATNVSSIGVFKTRLIDLSAGGAKIRNPGVGTSAGDVIHLKIFPGKAEPIKLKSRVTRVSPDGASLSVAFDLLKDSTRDQIMKLVFS